MLKINYLFGCPNCGGPIDDERLSAGIPCERCLPGKAESLDYRVTYDLLVKNSTLKGFAEYYFDNETYEEIIELFEKVIKNKPWNIQKYWIKRLAKNESFSLSAPTGLGKTTTLLIYSLYFNDSSLYIVPTNSLKDQICSRLKGIGANVICDNIRDKYINVATFRRVLKYYEEYESLKPKLVIVDDSDMILKSGKATEVIAKILGISDDIFQNAINLIKLKRMLKFDDSKELKDKINELQYKISSWKPYAQFLVASATLKPRGTKQQALRLLIGFEPSTIQTYLRNIVDLYYPSLDLKYVIEKISDTGGLILVSKEYGKEKMKELKVVIESLGYSTSLAVAGRKFMDKFSEGKIDFLIGSASYYGVAVRGLDEPKRLKYVIFYGVPKIRLSLDDALNNPSLVLKIGEKIGLDVKDIRKKIILLSPSELQLLKIGLKNKGKLNGNLEDIRNKIEELRETIYYELKQNSIQKIKGDYFIVSKTGNKYYVYIPDVTTYIQASGRSSRIINNGLTFGVSIILVDDFDLLYILIEKMKKSVIDVNLNNFNEIKIDEIKDKVKRSRESSISQKPINIKTVLIVVESPTKARTISRLFGRPSRREIYGIPVNETIIMVNDEILIANIVATRGHITDLTTENIGFHGVVVKKDENRFIANYSPIYKCYSCGRTFTMKIEKCPYCGSSFISSSEKIIAALRKLSTEVDEVYIASDPDQEGEKIAYDVALLIRPYNRNIYRIKYHEVTRSGIINAIINRTNIDYNLVKSQVVRRIEDRWIGFELSNSLKTMFYDRNQGTGRVQGPVLGWIVERTKEYKKNLGWVLYIKLGDYTVKKFFKTKDEAEKYVSQLNVKINKISEREELQNPLPPFTTDSLLVEAYSRLGINSVVAMKFAQELFESGLITYHRTDSVHVSSVGISIAKEYLDSKNLSENFVGRSWGSEGTHEAIRPTSIMDLEALIKDIEENPNKYFIQFTKYHLRLYDLIFRRFIASQMRPAIVKYARYEILVNDEKIEVELPVSVSSGFSIIYPVKTFKLSENFTTLISKGSSTSLYGYADVIKSMKEKEIGRPSTYAKTISTLIRHGYVIESKKKAMLVATKKGINVYGFLATHAKEFIDENRTKLLLQKIDKIANGTVDVNEVLLELYDEISDLSQRLVNSLKFKANI